MLSSIFEMIFHRQSTNVNIDLFDSPCGATGEEMRKAGKVKTEKAPRKREKGNGKWEGERERGK